MGNGAGTRLDRIDLVIKPTSVTRIPRRHIVWDTEAHSTYARQTTRQQWACGAYTLLDYSTRDAQPSGTVHTVDTTDELWDRVGRLCRAGQRTVMWAHNLGYDLRISRALIELPSRGWRLQGAVLERQAAWCNWKRGDCTLLMCDLYSWLPTTLAVIAKDLGMSKLPLADDMLQQRCVQDVVITAKAVHTILQYLWDEQLGSFRPTGPGMAYSAWRAQHMTERVVSHGDNNVLEYERRAMWTGRCEAWQWGSDRESPAMEYDIQSAYAHIGSECSVPTRYLGPVRIRDMAQLHGLVDRYAVLARIAVNTRVPVVPCERNGHIVWPVGQFETVLWDPELRMVAEQCESVQILSTYLYQRGAALSTVCSAFLTLLGQASNVVNPTVCRMVKSWSRSLIGRLALRYREWEPAGDAPSSDAYIMNAWDVDEQRQLTYMHVGHDLFELTDMHEGFASVPMITGWVMSEARRRLWELMSIAGMANVRYVDTDGIITNAEGSRRLQAAITSGTAYSLRLKHIHGRVVIHGPRNIVVGDSRRLSGVPSRASQTGPHSYKGEIWRGVADALQRGEIDNVTILPRTYTVKQQDPRRIHTPHYGTLPHTMR